ncbi:MAG: hypothetical protein GX288_03935 [Clostridiales bacterium]|nr:hypothetical protein [Clostridiales bacterium]
MNEFFFYYRIIDINYADYQSNLKLALIARNLVLKFYISELKNIPHKLIQIYDKMADIEKEVYLEVIDLISNSNYQD